MDWRTGGRLGAARGSGALLHSQTHTLLIKDPVRVEHRKNRERGEHERRWRGECISCDDSMLDIASSLYPSIEVQFLFLLSVSCVRRGKRRRSPCVFFVLILSPPCLWPRRLGLGSRLIFLSIGRYFCPTGYTVEPTGGKAHLAPDSRRPLYSFFFPSLSEGQIFSTFSGVTFSSSSFLFRFRTFYFFDFLLRRYRLGQWSYYFQTAVGMMAEKTKG